MICAPVTRDDSRYLCTCPILSFIARDLGIPIVPVAVTGMYDVMRKGSYLLRPGYDVTVYVERPIPTAGLRDDEIPALAAEVQRVVAARVDAYWREKAERGGAR